MVNCTKKGKTEESQFDIKTGNPTEEDNVETRYYDNKYFPVYDSRGKYLGSMLSILGFREGN